MSNSSSFSKKNRIQVQRDTIAYVERNKSKFHTRIIKYGNNMPLLSSSKKFVTNIIVTQQDTLEAVISSGLPNVGFLIFGNATNPGGGYAEGCPAQEESICRRTNLVNCFSKMSYPVPEFGCFYIKNLGIIRDMEKNDYNYFENIITADCVLSAAYHGPPIGNDNKLCQGYREKTKIKIQQILNAFLENENYILY